MRCWASGVAVVTVFHEGIPHGMTVNSFNSISLEPPIIAVTMTSNARTCRFALASGFLGVNILAYNQKELADRFSGRVGDVHNRFLQVAYHLGEYSIPVLEGALACMQCRITITHPLSQSTLILAEVLKIDEIHAGEPLIYFNRTYHPLGG